MGTFLFVLFKALPRVCMKYTALGESRVTNIAQGKAKCYICHRPSPRAVYFHIYKQSGSALSVLSRRAVVSRQAKKKQQARAYAYSGQQCNHYSELFTRMISLNFKNAVTQPLLQLSLSLLQTQHFLLCRTNS